MLAILEDELEARRSELADAWARAVISETPGADLAYREADRACRFVEERLIDQGGRLAALHMEDQARAAVGRRPHIGPNLNDARES